MSPRGWEALGQWGEDVVRIEPLACGVASAIVSAFDTIDPRHIDGANLTVRPGRLPHVIEA